MRNRSFVARWFAVLVFMSAAVAFAQQKADEPPKPVYPRISLAAGFTVDPAWPAQRSAHAWGQMPGVAVDADDLIWTFNRGEMPVQVYSPDGKLVRQWGDETIGRAHHIRVGPAGHVWITDLDLHVVRKFTKEGKLLMTIGTPGSAGDGPNRLHLPCDVAISPAGDVFIADGYGNNRVAHFDASGKFVKEWGGLGVKPGQFSLPHAIAIDSRGRLYVADRNNVRVQVFEQSGRLLAVWDNLLVPWGIWITPADEIYVCGSAPMHWGEGELPLGVPPKDQLIMKFTTDGRVQQVWTFTKGEDGKEQPGQLNWVHGIALDSRGNMYLGDIMGQRVQKFTPIGGARR